MDSHKEQIDSLRNNPKITILSIKHGLDAFNTAKELFFLNRTSKEKEDWAKGFVSSDTKSSTLIFYKEKLRINFKLGFRILIGDHSVLGEQKPLDEGLTRWASFLN
jgi:hypothetical protein